MDDDPSPEVEFNTVKRGDQPCEFCKTPTNDLVIEYVKSGPKYVCGQCLWVALEKAYKL